MIRAVSVSLSPKALMIMNKGDTVAIGGNIEIDNMEMSISFALYMLNFARAKAARDPNTRDRHVVVRETRRLFIIILKKE